MSVIGPIDLDTWNTLRQLRISINDVDVSTKRREREQFTFDTLLDLVRKAA